MAHIPLEDGLPGIIGLLEFRRDTAEPIRELTQILLRGPSTLTEGERELIAALVSHRNDCIFCTTAHTAASDLLLEDITITTAVKQNINSAPISEKLKALLKIASRVQEGGGHVVPGDIEHAKKHGATDLEIHDTVLIAALFCLYNRYVDGLATRTPENPDFYQTLARRLAGRGYLRPENGYEHLKYNEPKP